MAKALVYIVAYDAARHIENVLKRIPAHLWQEASVYLMDDASRDDTLEIAVACAKQHGWPLKAERTPRNLGYGGNQKHGYRFALDNGYDAVALLHGDGQYAPEYLPQLLAPVLSGEADVMLGSRMFSRRGALEGGMPLHKVIGNTGLTAYQNLLLGTRLHEFHTGYRVYGAQVLKRIPFERNHNGFVFDSEILIQCIDRGMRIRELPVPVFYGDEKSHVNSVVYGLQVLGATTASRLQKLGIKAWPQYSYD